MSAASRAARVIARIYKDTALILLNTLVLLVVLEVTASALLWLWLSAGDHRVEDAPSYYKSQDWGPAYLREAAHVIEDVEYKPYVMWKTKPHHGNYIRVDDEGNRVTPGSTCTAKSYKVFMFGGSTMWGQGVPDWGTIPAYVQATLSAARDTPVCVKNFGQPGWVSGQSAIELFRHLQAGEVPDLVIFYDGFNEVGLLWSDGVAGGHYHMGTIKDRIEGHDMRRTLAELVVWSHLFRLVERFDPSIGVLRDWPAQYKTPTFDEAAMTATIVRTYLGTYAAVRALAAAYGFQYAMFWQPSLHYTGKRLTAEEERFARTERTEQPGMPELLRSVYDRVKVEGRVLDHLFFIADLFEQIPESVYLDGVHLTHVGNHYVAALMVETLHTRIFGVQK